MITLTIQAVTNGYIVQRVKSRDMWDSCGKGYPEPFVYRNLDDLKEDLNTLFGIKTEEPPILSAEEKQKYAMYNKLPIHIAER